LNSRNEAKHILEEQSELDPSEMQYLLEYYSLVREGKTNYISTTGYHDVTGQHPLEPPEFFAQMMEIGLLEMQEGAAKNGKAGKDGPASKKRKANGS
jgi:hypothetical protein